MLKIGDRVIINKPEDVHDFPGWKDISGVQTVVSFSAHYDNIFQVCNSTWWYNKKWATKAECVIEKFKKRLML